MTETELEILNACTPENVSGIIVGERAFSEDFIRSYQHKLLPHNVKAYWRCASIHQVLSEAFIREFQDQVVWFEVSGMQILSEDFIREFQNQVEWCAISRHQKLSEAFIREFQDQVDWCGISSAQELSEDFIREFSRRVIWAFISRYQKLSEDFIQEFDLVIIPNNWLYTSVEEKRAAILACGLYEIEGDNVIAYKSCRRDGYSKYNFQYHYEVGKTYCCHADFNNDEENSFGLSAWTPEGAKGYCDEKVFKVACPLEHVAALVHQGHKLRCEQITILEEVI